MMKNRFFVWILLSVFLSIPSLSYGGKLQVIASIFPIADMARQVGGNDVEVTTVVPAGASPHTFEMKPSLVKTFASAKVFLMIGAGLEFWADQLVQSSGQKLKPVVLSDGMTLIRSADLHRDESVKEAPHASNKSAHTEHAHSHDSGNPHVWLDPHLAKTMVTRIQEALSIANPDHASDYENRAKSYLGELDALDKGISETVSQFSTRQIISFHPSWDYFAARYGLTLAGVIEKTPGRNPTPREIADIVSRIKAYHIRAVFAEPQFSPKVADVIAREAGVKVLILDPLGGETLVGRNTYIGLMTYNLQIMKEAMQ
ncbi:MAG: metal ABC transporter substrate-binding protein [Deltaproteobacteria bacterium]|nr:metal ABC transporter substrate-binding protein [Deltaproteobacteria bacterium]